MSKVAITHNMEDIGHAIHQAFECLSVKNLIQDKIVAVKTNETWASVRDTTACTQPDTLRAVLRYLKQFSPKELIVTGGSGAGETDEIFDILGLMDVVNEENAVFFDHNRGPFTEVKLDYAPEKDVDGPQRSIMVNPRILDYQTLVVVSQLKVHGTATVTLGLKNVAMSYPAADYYGHPRKKCVHPNEFFGDMHSFIASMAKRFPIHLSVIVGHPAMIGTGPIGGHTFETGLVIASTDPLAADVVGAELLGFSPQAVRHLWEAGRLGIGACEKEKMTFPALSCEKAMELYACAAYGKPFDTDHP